MDLPEQIKFAELMENPILVQSLKANVAGSFAEAAGVLVEYVTVEFVRKTSRRLDARKSSLRRLVAGGVQANAEIVAPADSTVAAVQNAIVQSVLATSIVGAVLNTSGIENAAPDHNLAELENLRTAMVTALSDPSAFVAPQVTTTQMVLDPSSPLANAAQQNLAPTTTTATSPATVDGGATTTGVPAGEATSGSRGLVAMTITTAAGAVLVAVSA